MTTTDLLQKIERLKLILVQRATGEGEQPEEYVKLRRELLNESKAKDKLPGFLSFCTTMAEFWSHIKGSFPSYQERRDYLRDQFFPVINKLESESTSPADQAITSVLTKVDSEHVREAWQKALERRESDPDGAITSARTLIEAVCKHVLDNTNVTYQDDWHLNDLYKETAKQLKLSPSQHIEDIFKQILSGCHSVIQGMAGLRNRLSDAHGKGKTGSKPKSRHAELAVNLAGTMATFLIATWEARSEQST
ncbi:MAG: abortive infection family protein [Planctomycetia bacterium]|nr:abortive infection family protein [Planctomycetia bacterium]